MRLLVLCRVLDIDRTSEGICTVKFLRLLCGAGHRVSVLTSERPVSGKTRDLLAGIPGCTLVGVVEPGGQQDRLPVAAALASRLAGEVHTGGGLARKVDGAVAHLLGWRLEFWQETAAWKAAIRAELSRQPYDVVFARAAGNRFETHVALAQLRPVTSWIAHYHDPFPMSLYPEPYRRRRPLLSARQESWHRRIVRTATALTFPGERLLNWVLCDDLEPCRDKAFVLPHVAAPLSPPPDKERPESGSLKPADFNVVHTGNLLGPRDPTALIEGFLRFIQRVPEAAGKARLLLVGSVSPSQRSRPVWQLVESCSHVVILEARVTYEEATRLARAAAACVVLEANASVSPFFPAKLADYLWLNKPVLALSPNQSTVADLLGPGHPLLVAPGDTEGVVAALGRLWDSWKLGKLELLAPRPEASETVSETAVTARIQSVLSFAAARSEGRQN